MTPKPQSNIERLENTVNQFVSTTTTLVEEDHKKIDLVYDFLFLGQPTADPPIPPFVAMVQNSLSSHTKEISGMKTVAARLIWLLVGVLISGGAWFIGTTILHIAAK